MSNYPLPWRIQEHDGYMPDDSAPIEIVAANGRVVACNTAYYPKAISQEAAGMIVSAVNATTLTPAEVSGLVDAQTEARAIVSAILVDERLAVGYQIETLADAIVEHIATALAAKDEKIQALNDECQQSMLDIARERDRAERAEAALAEAMKALEERDADITEFMGRLGSRWFLEQGWFPKSVGAREDAARRALTGGKVDGL